MRDSARPQKIAHVGERQDTPRCFSTRSRVTRNQAQARLAGYESIDIAAAARAAIAPSSSTPRAIPSTAVLPEQHSRRTSPQRIERAATRPGTPRNRWRSNCPSILKSSVKERGSESIAREGRRDMPCRERRAPRVPARRRSARRDSADRCRFSPMPMTTCAVPPAHPRLDQDTADFSVLEPDIVRPLQTDAPRAESAERAANRPRPRPGSRSNSTARGIAKCPAER